MLCTDNRFKVIEELKNYIIEATNIETSPDEMKVLDDFCFRLWQLDLTLETKRKLKELQNDIKLNETQIDDLTLEVANYKHALEEKNEIIMDLKEKNQELKSKYNDLMLDFKMFDFNTLKQENEKLKKAIEILKMQTSIENIKCENGNIYIVHIGDISVLINKQEYELLKEVL